MNIRKHLEALPAYTPIEPFEILSAKIGRSAEQIIKLDANENPYGILPAIRKALANIDFPHIYPDPESRALRKAISAFVGVDEKFLLAGSGADELLDLIMRVFLDPDDCIVSCPPTFGMYAFDAELNAARIIEVQRNADFSLDVTAIRNAVHEHKPKLLFLASPNNPDGSLLDAPILDELLTLPVMIVLDEAYIEFADNKALKPQSSAADFGASLSRIHDVPSRENLIVLRTFSKWAGLAGLRIGYGAFPLWLMPTLWKAKQPYNVNVAASVAAQVALENISELKKVVEVLKAERERFFSALQSISYLKPYPTQSNFILCKVIGKDALALKTKLAEEYGIFIRYFNKAGLKDHIRISVGKPEEMDRLIEVMKKLDGK